MYDLVIIGSGPAGLSAAVYAKRACLSVLVIEKEAMSGGQMIYTEEVDNYLGLNHRSGFELAEAFEQHARDLDVTFTEGEKPKDNNNPPTEYDAYPGGTINTNTITIKVVNPVQINGYYTDGEDDGYDVTVMRDYVIDYFSDTLYTLYITIPDEIEDALGKFKIYLPSEFSVFGVKQYNSSSGKYDTNIEMKLIEGETSKYIRTNDISDTFGPAKYEIKLSK